MYALIVPIVAFSEFSWIDREQPSRTVVFLKCEAYNRSFSSFPLSKTCFISLQANSVVQRKMANITIIKLLYVSKSFDFFQAFYRIIMYFGENRSNFSVENIFIERMF